MCLANWISADVVVAEHAFFVRRILRGGCGHLRERRLPCFVSVYNYIGGKESLLERMLLEMIVRRLVIVLIYHDMSDILCRAAARLAGRLTGTLTSRSILSWAAVHAMYKV